ncbi:peptidoglycan-binding protein [Tolypothrix bouteillei VB521301_2]|uniref:Peptidoglycan binding-like domain-containing protein n=1 Tax=Tolypothrix bouteillei VB521301 TaxID=1479485 RepID=A0A0C1NAA0_9CYAN
MLAKITKFIRANLTSLGVVSAFAIAPVFIGISPANAQIYVDGYLAEYNPDTAPVLNFDDRGPLVRDIQAFLRSRGYYFGRIDGIYGRRTAQAIRNFQFVNGLRVDGVVGENTWQALSNRSTFDYYGFYN